MKVQKTVVVLGMHRTGTSLAAGMLHLLGINMGSYFFGKTSNNPTGHFEDLDFLYLNQDILHDAGGDWMNPPAHSTILKQAPEYSERIKSLVNKRNKQCMVWGWKDPRTCLTFDLYKKYLVNPYLIICKRPNEQIADSLLRRQNLMENAGLELATIYKDRINNIVSSFPEEKILHLHFDDLRHNPFIAVHSVRQFLSLQIDHRRINKAIKLVKNKKELFRLQRRRRNIERIKSTMKKVFGKQSSS